MERHHKIEKGVRGTRFPNSRKNALQKKDNQRIGRTPKSCTENRDPHEKAILMGQAWDGLKRDENARAGNVREDLTKGGQYRGNTKVPVLRELRHGQGEGRQIRQKNRFVVFAQGFGGAEPGKRCSTAKTE